MVGVELRTRAKSPGGSGAAAVLRGLMEHGVLAMPAGTTTVRFLPPLIISEAQLDTVVQTLARVLREVE
jgi:4-aminobutyrate aminotransferase-like enzyme